MCVCGDLKGLENAILCNNVLAKFRSIAMKFCFQSYNLLISKNLFSINVKEKIFIYIKQTFTNLNKFRTFFRLLSIQFFRL